MFANELVTVEEEMRMKKQNADSEGPEVLMRKSYRLEIPIAISKGTLGKCGAAKPEMVSPTKRLPGVRTRPVPCGCPNARTLPHRYTRVLTR